MTSRDALSAILNPVSVAVVGASESPGKAAERRTRSLLSGGYQGRVYLINPKRDRLFDRPAYPSLKEVDGPVDLVMIVIPGPFIPQAMEEAAAKGAKGAIIITAGLGETGPEGKAIEARIMEVADRNGIQVIGPNCSGVFSASGGMNLLGIPGIRPGRLSVLAQSGNIIDSLTHFAHRRGRGFSKIISSGNAIGVRFHDYLDLLAEDPETGVIMLYLESIRFGDRMVQAARKAAAKKPVIALKVGRTEAGARASASHTGALAANDRIVEAAFLQAGIIRVSNVDEMFDLAEGLLDCPLPGGNRVAILSEGGGDNSVAADNAERWGLEVPLLELDRQEAIKRHLLKGMPAHNPIDYGGTAEENPAVIHRCVDEVMSDELIDMVYLTGFFGGFKEIIAPHVGELEAEASRRLVELVKTHGKPLVVHTSFAAEPYPAIEILKSGGIPVLESSDRTAQCLSALALQAQNKARFARIELIQGPGSGRDKARAIFDSVLERKRTNLLETESRELLSAYGIPLPRAELIRDPEQAAALAEELGLPLACKIVSPDIVHKSEAGGVRLDLLSPEEVKEGVKQVLAKAGELTSRERIEGCLLMPMAAPGQEVILGFIRDPAFGPVVMFGLGGIFVEVLKDVSFGVAPLTEDDLVQMIHSIQGHPLLSGVRGRPPCDTAAIKDLLRRLSLIGLENPEVAEIDLNPVIVHQEGATVVDTRVILTGTRTSPLDSASKANQGL